MTHKNIWACSGYMQLKIYFDLQFLEFTDVDPWVWRNYYLWGKKKTEFQSTHCGLGRTVMGAFVLGKCLWAPPSHNHEMFIQGLDFWKHILWYMHTFALSFFNLNGSTQSPIDKPASGVSICQGCQWQNWAARCRHWYRLERSNSLHFQCMVHAFKGTFTHLASCLD